MPLLLFFRWSTKDQRTQVELLTVSFNRQKLTRVKLSQREGNGIVLIALKRSKWIWFGKDRNQEFPGDVSSRNQWSPLGEISYRFFPNLCHGGQDLHFWKGESDRLGVTFLSGQPGKSHTALPLEEPCIWFDSLLLPYRNSIEILNKFWTRGLTNYVASHALFQWMQDALIDGLIKIAYSGDQVVF